MLGHYHMKDREWEVGLPPENLLRIVEIAVGRPQSHAVCEVESLIFSQSPEREQLRTIHASQHRHWGLSDLGRYLTFCIGK